MPRIVQSFSVSDGSKAHDVLREWNKEGVNISVRIQELIESAVDDRMRVSALERGKEAIRNRIRDYSKELLEMMINEGFFDDRGNAN
jgi:hypothetical protein